MEQLSTTDPTSNPCTCTGTPEVQQPHGPPRAALRNTPWQRPPLAARARGTLPFGSRARRNPPYSARRLDHHPTTTLAHAAQPSRLPDPTLIRLSAMEKTEQLSAYVSTRPRRRDARLCTSRYTRNTIRREPMGCHKRQTGDAVPACRKLQCICTRQDWPGPLAAMARHQTLCRTPCSDTSTVAGLPQACWRLRRQPMCTNKADGDPMQQSPVGRHIAGRLCGSPDRVHAVRFYSAWPSLAHHYILRQD